MPHSILSSSILGATLCLGVFSSCDKAPSAGTPATDPPKDPPKDPPLTPESPPAAGAEAPASGSPEPGAPVAKIPGEVPGAPPANEPSPDDSAALPPDDPGERSGRPEAAADSGPGGRAASAFTDCTRREVFADGRCYASHEAACTALGCAKESCMQLRSMPPQARCSAKGSGAPPKEGRKVKAFTECARNEVFGDGRCYSSQDAACEAMGCEGACAQLKSMPPQATCRNKK